MDDRAVIAIQKIQCTVQVLPVLLLADVALAGGLALLDVVIQAGPLRSDVSGETAVAGAQLVQLADQLDGILYCSCAGVRAIVP